MGRSLGIGVTLGVTDGVKVGITMPNSNYANVVTLATVATEVAEIAGGGHLIAFRPVTGGHTTVGVTAEQSGEGDLQR